MLNLVINSLQCRIIVNNVKQKPSVSINDRTSSIDCSIANSSKRTLPHKVNTAVFKPRLVFAFRYSSAKTWGGGVYI